MAMRRAPLGGRVDELGRSGFRAVLSDQDGEVVERGMESSTCVVTASEVDDYSHEQWVSELQTHLAAERRGRRGDDTMIER